MRSNTLHRPSKELAEANKITWLDPYDPASWSTREAYDHFMEGRNMKMPAHRPPLTAEERMWKHYR